MTCVCPTRSPRGLQLCVSAGAISYFIVGIAGMQRAGPRHGESQFKLRSGYFFRCSIIHRVWGRCARTALRNASSAHHAPPSYVASCHSVSSPFASSACGWTGPPHLSRPKQPCPLLRRRRVGSERRGRTARSVVGHHARRHNDTFTHHLSSGFSDKRPMGSACVHHNDAMASSHGGDLGIPPQGFRMTCRAF